MGMLDNKLFEDKAWDDMLTLLDKEMPEKKAFPWSRLLLLLLLLVFVGGGSLYYWLDRSTTSDSDSSLSSSTIQIAQQATNSDSENHALEAPAEVQPLSEPNLFNTENQFASSEKSSSIVTTTISTKKTKGQNLSAYSKPIHSAPTGSIEPILASVHSDQTSMEDQTTLAASTKSLPTFEALTVATDHLAFSDITLLNWTVASPSALVDFSILENATPEILKPSRRVNLYGYAESNYISHFNSLGLKLGLVAEIGAASSPWSFSTGALWDHNSLSSFELYRNAVDNVVLEQDTTPEVINTPIEIADASQLISVNYLTIPMQFHYRMNRFKVGLGIQHRFLFRQRLKNGETLNKFLDGEPAGSFVNQGIQSNINPYHLSVNQSLMYRVHPRIDLGLAFQYDLTGIFAASSFTSQNNRASNKLDNIGLSIAYRLR